MESRRGLGPSGARDPSSWALHYADAGKRTLQKQHLLSVLSYPSSLVTMCHLCGTAFPGVCFRDMPGHQEVLKSKTRLSNYADS